ncbi:hypothetical protein CL628_04130 [bacterium]|nr:hypothetical protein [bacterium]
MNKCSLVVIGGVVVAVLLIGGFVVFMTPATSTEAPTGTPKTVVTKMKELMLPSVSDTAVQSVRTIRAADIPGISSAFEFSATVPASWEAEPIPTIGAMNIYDPSTARSGSLEQSQIFIRSFSANTFLTLSTVTILNVEDLTIAGRPAREYQIVRKPGVAVFPSQPSWRSDEHIVTDVRVTDSNPSVFYVIAKRPDLDPAIYQAFLDSLQVVAGEETTQLLPPIAEMAQRITKKPFGIFITPENSPISPERFRGFHTGIDVEFEDVIADVPVTAVTDGQVVRSQTASGYGGVTVLQHTINGASYTGLYGHLDPGSLLPVGAVVTAGQRIGILGEGGTQATDGARKHLHFSLHPGTNIDLRGYVTSQSELTAWVDPLELL